MPAGRPTDYKAEYVDQAYKFCLLGATDEDLGRMFEVNEATVKRWMQKYPEFRASIKRGREIADAEVAEKLYHRAKGYSHEAVKIFNGPDGPIYAPYTEHYPPDTQAASLWLRNRQSGKWRDTKNLEHTGKDGDPLQILLEQAAGSTPQARVDDKNRKP